MENGAKIGPSVWSNFPGDFQFLAYPPDAVADCGAAFPVSVRLQFVLVVTFGDVFVIVFIDCLDGVLWHFVDAIELKGELCNAVVAAMGDVSIPKALEKLAAKPG